MTYCEYCDSKVGDGITTCPNCGAPITVSADTPSTTASSEPNPTQSTGSGTGTTTASMAGAALGGTLLSSLLRGLAGMRHVSPPHMPMNGMGGHYRGHRGGMGRPMGGPGHMGGGRGPGGPRGGGRGPGGRR